MLILIMILRWDDDDNDIENRWCWWWWCMLCMYMGVRVSKVIWSCSKFKWIQTKLILFSIFFFLFFSSIVKCLNFIFVATGKDVVDEVAAVGAEVVETETKVALTQGLRFYPAFRILPFLFSEKNIVFSVIGTGDILYTWWFLCLCIWL